MTAKTPGVDSLLYEALEMPSDEARREFLQAASGGDPALLREVECLLEAHLRAGNFLNSAAVPPTLAFGPSDAESAQAMLTGTEVGPYRLIEVIGDGGMGVVYRAEQREPVRRQVALKVIKPGMDTKQVLARFEAERQALALMDHPNIARVLDGGLTETGHPYFVMELVRGLPITEHCDRERLSIAARLELFVLVCRAVQHAHQKGVIHRDIKPSNVMVTVVDGVAVPKVIDFGVAKALGEPLTERTLQTGFHQLVGTPLYMSPEQAALCGVDVDTRSDIYSLGVLLYELLTGTTPFDREALERAAFDEMRRIIRDEVPPKPSTRLSSLSNELRGEVSQRRQVDPRQLNRLVGGDLNWIVMRTLEKDRERRYETANGLAADVMRHLKAQPVQACPPSVAYRFSRFARRNRGMLVSGCLIVLSLIAGTAVSVWESILAREAARAAAEASREADLRAEESKQVIDYLTKNFFIEVAQGNRSMTLGEFLDQVDSTLETRYKDKPLVEAAIRLALGEVDNQLVRRDRLPIQAARAAELRERYLGALHPATLEARHVQAYHLCARGWYFPGNRYHPEAAEQAEALFRKVLAAQQQVLGPTHPDTLFTQGRLAMTISNLLRQEEAEALAVEVERLGLQSVGPEHQSTLTGGYVQGLAAFRRGDFQRAESVIRRHLAIQERAFGPLDMYTLYFHRLLSNIVDNSGQKAAAVPLYLETIDRFSRVMGFCHIGVDVDINDLQGVLQSAGDYTAIRDIWEGWLRTLLPTPLPADPYSRERRAIRLGSLINTLVSLPESVPFDIALAEHAARQVVELVPDSDARSMALVDVYAAAGRVEEAGAIVVESTDSIGKDPKMWNLMVWRAVEFNASPARSTVMASIMERVVKARPDEGAYWNTLGVARYRAGDWKGSIEALVRARELNQDRFLAHDGFFLAMAHAQLGDTKSAQAWFEKSVDWMEENSPTGELPIFRAESAKLLGLPSPP